jgi:hypothetical protein
LGTRKATDKGLRVSRPIQVPNSVVKPMPTDVFPRACSSGVPLNGVGGARIHCMHWVPGMLTADERAKECRKFDMHLCSKSEVERHFHFGTPVCLEAFVANPSDAGKCLSLQGNVLQMCDMKMPEAPKGSMSVTDAECDKEGSAYCCATL